MALNPKRQRFVEEYLVDLNGTQAAIRAGYSKKTANEQASRLLATVSVQEAIQAAQAKRAKKTKITQEMVLQRLWEEGQRTGEGATHGARVRALELVGRHQGMRFAERKELTDAEGDPLPVIGIEIVAAEERDDAGQDDPADEAGDGGR